MPEMPPGTKWVAFAFCAYECGAVASSRYPTLTELSSRYRLVAPALVGLLAVHLYWTPREKAEA